MTAALLVCFSSLSSLRPQVMGTARQGEIKKIEVPTLQIGTFHCLTAGCVPVLAGHAGVVPSVFVLV